MAKEKIKQLVKHIALSLVCIMPCANCMGQICQNLDSTIIGVFPINKNDLEKLPLSRCTYTALPHFQTEQGVRIGMTREELIALKGDQFCKNKDGYICYTSLSPYAPDDPEAIEYYEKHGLGDLFLDVHIEEGRVD